MGAALEVDDSILRCLKTELLGLGISARLMALLLLLLDAVLDP